VPRFQLNTKMDYDLYDELREYAIVQDATMQDVIEAAVREYIDAHPATRKRRS
jgi:hypothetical protein